MIDPVIQLLASLAFSLLFVFAGVHKLTNRLRFQGILEAYQIMPAAMVSLAVLIIGSFEILLGFAWLFSSSVVVAFLSIVLLSIYICAISINLYRGRTYIDCGCGFSAFSGKQNSDSGIQQLSFGLVIRNYGLVIVAFVCTLPTTQRVLSVIDFFGIASGLIVTLLIYAAINQLLSNNNAIGAWRNVSG